MPTAFGTFQLVAYQDTIDNQIHFALVNGQISSDEPTLVRVHIVNPLCDLTASIRDECGWPRVSIARVAEEQKGVVVILQQQEDTKALLSRIQHCSRHDRELHRLPLHRNRIYARTD
ncbi:MAG: hypothetical protein R3E08_02535 [Thiotrichaceae bacterium]